MQKELDLDINGVGGNGPDTNNLMRLIQGTVMPQVRLIILNTIYSFYFSNLYLYLYSMYLIISSSVFVFCLYQRFNYYKILIFNNQQLLKTIQYNVQLCRSMQERVRSPEYSSHLTGGSLLHPPHRYSSLAPARQEWLLLRHQIRIRQVQGPSHPCPPGETIQCHLQPSLYPLI